MGKSRVPATWAALTAFPALLSPAFAQTTPPPATPLPAAGPSIWPYLEMIGLLLALVGALVLALWAFKRYGAKLGFDPGRGLLEPKARMPLGGNRSVVVVRFLNKLLVLGVTDHAVTKLAETPFDHADPHSQDFRNALASAVQADDGLKPKP